MSNIERIEAMIEELAKSQQETDRLMREAEEKRVRDREETERLMREAEEKRIRDQEVAEEKRIRDQKEAEEKRARDREETERLMREAEEKHARRTEEMDRKLQETRDLIETLSAKTDRKLQETRDLLRTSDEKTDQQLRELAVQLKLLRTSDEKTDQQLRELAAQLKSTDRDFNGKWGAFIEALVEGEVIALLQDRGIAVTRLLSNTKGFGDNGEVLCEFDIIAVNGEEVVVVEVKTHLTVKKINTFMAKLATFKKWFTEYRDRKVYGAIAFIRKEEHSDIYAQRKKLLVIRAVGKGGVILNDRKCELQEF